MPYTFKGGIHVEEHKYTSDSPIEELPKTDIIKISMSQNIGAPSVPVVSKGDTVTVGQVIGVVPEGALGCPVHSSVSGVVTDIIEIRVPSGALEKEIVIENDGLDTVCPDVKPAEKPLKEFTREELVERIRSAGISGMGGAAFPTYAKIQSAIGKSELLIVNCAECEPFITADHRLLLENAEKVIGGVKILLKAVGAPVAYIAVEDNKINAIKHLKDILKDNSLIQVKVMKTKYPQGDERQLIYALTGKELPVGKLPADVGCVIFNAATCSAVYTAFIDGMPLVKRIITVSGDCIKEPKNISCPVGTLASDLVEYCGGLVKTPDEVIFGGPMMGRSIWDVGMSVKKSTSSVLFLSSDVTENDIKTSVCIRCGRCIKNCPMHLMPAYIAQFVMHDDMDGAKKYGAMNCVECGSCSYNCPGKVEIVQYIRVAKNYIRTEAARMKKAKENSDK